jgi:hypothetical protein
MAAPSSVVADPAAGAAFVAGTRVAMSAAGATGAMRFGGAEGSVLRPLSFAERTDLVSSATTTDAVAAGILNAATVERGDGATTLLEVLALWLAGADFDAPDFTETTLLVARAAGWQPWDLFAAPAREIDRLAMHLGESSEWNSLLFAEERVETLEEVRERFAERLLARSNARVSSSDPLTPAAAVVASTGNARAETRAPFEEAAPLVRGVRLLVPAKQAFVPGREESVTARGHRALQQSHDDVVPAQRGDGLQPVAATFRLRNESATAAAELPPAPIAAPRRGNRGQTVAPGSDGKRGHAMDTEHAMDMGLAMDTGLALQEHSRDGLKPVATFGTAHVSPREGAAHQQSRTGWEWEHAGFAERAASTSRAQRRQAGAEQAGEAARVADVAATLAMLLDDECDLRGVER